MSTLRMISAIVAGRCGCKRAVAGIYSFAHLITVRPSHSWGNASSPFRFTSLLQFTSRKTFCGTSKAEDFRANIQTAVDDYVNNVATILNVSKDNLEDVTTGLLKCMEENEFWNKTTRLQRWSIGRFTQNMLYQKRNIDVRPDDFSSAIDFLMQEFHLITGVYADSRLFPVDYHIDDTEVKYQFDLRKFVAKIRSVADEWDATKDDLYFDKKYIAPYFCFIQSNGMGKTKLMYEFAKLTKMTSSNAHKGMNNVIEDFSCDLILSGDIWREKVPINDIFDYTLDVQDFVTDPHRDAYAVASTVQNHLENILVRSRPMKKTHVFLFDEAQVLLATHKNIEAFLFRCIRMWLRRKRNGTSVIGVFSGTTTDLLNYTKETDLLMDDKLEKTHFPSSRDPFYRIATYSRGSRTFEPFLTLTTMTVLQSTKEIPNQSDYDKSIPYGRPLFAKMHEQNELEPRLHAILKRLLLDTGKEGFDWGEEKESWLSVLATRVQMGPTKLDVVSQLVAKGYAYLTRVKPYSATFVNMPDPVCARLAMCMMDENWRLESWQGKSKKWWSDALKTLYSSGLCLREEDNVGEVLVALYFLFCCDECRQSIEGNMNYTTFSVPLEDWIDALNDKGSRSGSVGKRNLEPTAVRVSFIQVSRDYMRSPWKGLDDQVFLENLYNAGTAFFTYPGCDMINFVAPTVITTGNTKPTYSTVLVSIQSGFFSPHDARKLCAKMKRKADKCQLKSALCIVCIFGQTSVSNDGKYAYDASMLRKLAEGQNVATVLRLPHSDRFGLTDIFHKVTAATEESELLISHSTLRALGQTARDALRMNDDDHPGKTGDDFQELMKDMDEEKENNDTVYF